MFAGSRLLGPERWAIYKDTVACFLHSLSDTRWSAQIDAVKPVAKHLPDVIEALSAILSTCSLSNEARAEAFGLRKYFSSFDAIVLLTIWVKVLQCIDDRNIILQSGKISLEAEAANVRDLKNEMQNLRDIWDVLLSEASLIASQMRVPPKFNKKLGRVRKRKRLSDETPGPEEGQKDSGDKVFRNTVFFHCHGPHYL